MTDNKNKKEIKNSYIYPGQLSGADGEYILTFPDFPNMSPVYGSSITALIERAQEALALLIIDMKQNNLEPPVPSEIHGSETVYVHIVLPYYIGITKTVYVKKTVTIPEYLNILAEEKKINFSKTLADGIKAELERLGTDRNLIEP
jgi:predicted RNase H-like HicB family nuclease